MQTESEGMKPLVILGCVRSGTTILHKLLMSACPSAVDLTDDDFESRYYWQDLGVRIGSRSTGTYCDAAGHGDVDEEKIVKIRDYIKDRTRGRKVVTTKNPHLLNKVPFVASVLPEARFIMIVRDAMSVVASKKQGLQKANTQNNEYPPFVHYWPEGDSPCWWTLLNDRRFDVTAGLIKRMTKRALCALGLRRRKTLMSPGKTYRHERLSAFVKKNPDLSRYYPGQGFPRLAEAWLKLNANAYRALRDIDRNRWLHVTYSQLVAQPRQTISAICDFAGISPTKLESVPERLDDAPSRKWRKALSTQEQQIVVDYMKNSGREEFQMLCKEFGQDLLGLQN